jgi:uncharacterized protein YndB with AHSA1/START domain
MSAATKKNPASTQSTKSSSKTAPRTARVTTPGDVEIRMERELDAPRERVWRALTEPKLLAQWWGRGNNLEIRTMDFREGGRWNYVEHAPHGDFEFFGSYTKIVPIERIEFTFGFTGMEGEGPCVIELHDLGKGKTLLVDRALVGSREGVDAVLASGMVGGANQSYAALDRVLAAME